MTGSRLDPTALLVKPGQYVRPVFNAFLDLLLALRLLGGQGVLLTYGPKGVSINARSAYLPFEGSFFARLAGDVATLSLGLVNDGLGNIFEPTIDGRPISGSDGKPAPQLKIDPKLYDAASRSWIAIEATIDKGTGRLSTPDGKKALGLRVVQVSSLVSPSDLIGIYPVALLVKDPKTSVITLHQIAYFDVVHSTSRTDAGKYRHFFNPA